MPTTTANGLKATEIKGYSRLYLVENGWRLAVVEVKPGARIEDVDTSKVFRAGSPDENYVSHLESHLLDRRNAIEGAQPGWYLDLPRNNHVGPLPTKTEAIHQIRLCLPEITSWYWRDEPAATLTNTTGESAMTSTYTGVGFSDVAVGDRLRFLTADNGFGGTGDLKVRTGTVTKITAKTFVLDCGPGETAVIRRAAWGAREPQKVTATASTTPKEA